MRDFDKAEVICRKILKKKTDSADALHLLGLIYSQRGQLELAIDTINNALKFDKKFPEAYNNLGNICQETKRLDEAIACYHKALRLDPRSAETYYNLGVCLQDKRQLDEAIDCYHKALHYNLNSFGLFNNLGLALYDKGMFDDAIVYYQNAIRLNPSFAEAYYNLGKVYQDKEQLDVAISYYQKALQCNPEYADVWNNLGLAFKEKGQIDEAMQCFDKALQISPEFASAHWNSALAFLLTSNFMRGWEEYEWRWELEDFHLHPFPQPRWDGYDLRGRTIFLHAEQGFGDTIQFIRYVPLVAEMGAKTIVQTQEALISLARNIPGINQVVSSEVPVPLFDVHCPLLSLPCVFRTTMETIPSAVPYITADARLAERWKKRMHSDIEEIKLGLVWAGKPTHKRDRYRSCSLSVYAPLAEIKDISFYSLQKGERAQDGQYPPPGMKLIDWSDELHDFSDTAALIANLDLILSVDTSVAHLAGAMGKPVWTLLPFMPDWRWMLDREDSPWYPTMRLFRQPAPGDWESVMERVSEELTKVVVKQYKAGKVRLY